MNDATMAENDVKININIRIGDVKPIALSINQRDEATYREAEQLVNSLLKNWTERFKNTHSSDEVMARVAFQFARLYAQAYATQQDTAHALNEFEQKLNDIVVKL